MSDDRGIIAKRLVEARLDQGWSIAEAARRMHFSRSRYSNWELDIRQPRYEELETAANVLGVSPAWLAGWSDQHSESDYRPINRTTALLGDENTHIANATDIEALRQGYLEERNLEARQLIHIRIDDDAMADVVKRGDLVLVDLSRRRSEIRDLFAILVNGRVWVRWIRPELSGNYTLSAEDSRQYPEETLTPEQLERLNIIGRIARIERDR
jgi:transcriptional regulator with XRE-family HTH domain